MIAFIGDLCSHADASRMHWSADQVDNNRMGLANMYSIATIAGDVLMLGAIAGKSLIDKQHTSGTSIKTTCQRRLTLAVEA